MANETERRGHSALGEALTQTGGKRGFFTRGNLDFSRGLLHEARLPKPLAAASLWPLATS